MLNRRNFIASLGAAPGVLLLKPDLNIPMGKNIQGKSADMVIIDEAPSKWSGYDPAFKPHWTNIATMRGEMVNGKLKMTPISFKEFYKM